ncbi:hypothetical protein NDU88_011465 [Pleurodeles waltl]|uniref:Uncharacterized protein n=1 Tax=Pleurodeles waltl TaxID=8319 RepID=A0AAV7R1R0_PLEWA|nr:hypothetical protein NDU88_011465 [Pleurodeles waltl]
MPRRTMRVFSTLVMRHPKVKKDLGVKPQVQEGCRRLFFSRAPIILCSQNLGSPLLHLPLLATASSEVSEREVGRPPRKLITSFYQKVDKAALLQQTNEKKKEKEGSRVQGGDLEKNDNVNDHGDGADMDGESDECFERE